MPRETNFEVEEEEERERERKEKRGKKIFFNVDDETTFLKKKACHVLGKTVAFPKLRGKNCWLQVVGWW